MLSPQEIEATIEDSGGVPVVVGAVSTWGHVDVGSDHHFGSGTAADSSGGRSATDRVVSVADVGLPALAVGAAITVDGQVERVRAFGPDEAREMILILLANRSHVINVYAEQVAVATARGRRTSAWNLVAGSVECNLEAVSGELDPEAGGQRVGERWRAFIPREIPMAANQAVTNVSGGGPPRFRVLVVADHGEGWDQVVELVATEEAFP